MPGLTPRDTREWMRTIERGLREARSAAGSVGTIVDSKLPQIIDTVNADRNRVPAAPIELTAQTYIALGPNKRFQAGAIIDFPDVTIDSTGAPMEISEYELWGRTGTGNFNRLVSAEVSALQWFGADPGTVWDFKARAIGAFSVKPGLFSAVKTVTMLEDTVAPGMPSTPTAVKSGKAAVVRWDGKIAGGAAMPLDLDYVIVAGGVDPSPTTEIGRLAPGGFDLFVDVNVEYNTPKFYRLRAVDTSGNLSAWSAQASVTVTPLVDVDVILAHLDAATTEIVNIGAESIKSGAILTSKLADNAVSQVKLQDQIVSLAKLDTSANNKIQKGIDDAFTAKGIADAAAGNATTAISNAAAADTKAGNAQTAADKAKAYADAMIASGPSLVLNGGFETDEFWPLNAAMSYDSTEKRSGARSLKIVSTDTADAWPLNAWFDAATGRTYRVEFWVKRSGTVSITGAVAAVFQVKTSAGGTATPTALPVPNISSLQISDTGYTKVTVDYTVTTANVIQARIAPWLKRGLGNTYWVDDITAYDITEAKEALDAAKAAQLKADQAFDDAFEANELAGQAQESANGKNNTFYLAAKPSGAGFADGDTVFIRTAPGAPITEQWKWNKTGPSTGSWESQSLGHQIMASVDLGKATIGELNGIYVKAFSLSADTLKIGSGHNLFPDPKMLDTGGWGAVAGLTLEGVGTGKNGQGSMLIAPSATQVGSYYSNGDLNRRIPVAPNSSYRLTIWVRSDQNIPVGGVAFYARQYPLDGSAFSFTTPGSITNNILSVGGDGTIAANTWTPVTGVVTTGPVPSSLVVGPHKQAITPGGVRFSDPTIEIMGVGRLIVDGTIQGNHVATNSITAKHMTMTDLTNFAPSLAESPTDWSLTNSMEIIATSLDPSGYRFNVTNATAADNRAYGPYMAVKPGENLWMGATLYRGSGTVAAYLRYEFADANKIGLAGSAGTNYVGVPMSSASASGVRFEGSALVPAGAAYARWHVIIGAGTGSTGFHSIVGRRRLAAELIVDGTVTSDKVATNGITAKQILVGDFQNFAIGSDFEDATAVPWVLASTHTITTSQKKSGTSSLRLAANAAVQSSLFIGDLRVKEGEQYYFKYHAYIDAAFNGTANNSKLRVGNALTGGTFIQAVDFTTITRSAWTTNPLEMTVTIPAGVTSLKVEIVSDNTAGTAYIDDIQIRRVSEASLIMNLGVEKLTASNAAMNSAVIDKLWTDVVRSRRIDTDMLTVGRGTNLIVDEYFGAADIKAYRHTLAGSWGAWALSAGTGLQMYTAGTLTAGTARSFFWDATDPAYNKATYIPVQPGQRYLLSMQYTSGTSGPRATARIIRRDGTTAYTSSYWEARDGTGNVYGGSGSTVTLERVFVVPADVTHFMPAVQFEATCTSATVYGGATLTNMATSSLIVDGAIAARNLTVTEEMWTKILHFKKLGGDEIDANLLTADVAFIGVIRDGVIINDSVDTGNLKAGAITSKHTITGATIQTLTTANRGIKISGGNLNVYDATGTGAKTFSITGSTGAVDGTGTWRTGSSGNYAEMSGGSNGGIMRFYTGSGTGRGSIWARDDATDGPKMSIAYSNLDEPSGTLPVIVATPDKVYMRYGSRAIQTWNNAGVEELLLDASGANVILRGGLDLREGGNRVRFRYQSTTILGYLGQRPESGTAADFELRAEAGGVRISGSDLTAMPIWNNTSSSAANVFIGSDGLVKRVSSASRYKADQQLVELPDSLLDIQVKDWVDKAALALKEEMDAQARPFIETDQRKFDAINLRRVTGVIAEDVEAHSGPRFVTYGPDGRTESVEYDRLALGQIAVLKRQLDEAVNRITELENA